MKRNILRCISLILCCIMLGSLVPASVFAADAETMVLSTGSAIGMPGETVQITVDISENPGIASLKFHVSYDDVLTLQKIEFSSSFGAYVTAPEPYKNPQPISFISPLSEVSANGTFATLTFLVSSDAPDHYVADITVTCDPDNVFDGDYNDVHVNVINGSVTVLHGLPGDIDGDRNVNNKDAILLFRYVAGDDVTVDPDALDVNGDGRVNNIDAVHLFRYLAGWDVEISRGPAASTECRHHTVKKMPAKLPTCTEDGYSEWGQCADCGQTVDEPVTLPAVGHVYQSGVCRWCGHDSGDKYGAPGYYCGGSKENFTSVGNVAIVYDSNAANKLNLHNASMWDWSRNYTPITITPENMISWVGGSADDPTGGVPEGWKVDAYFVADANYLYIGLHVTDPEVILVSDPKSYSQGDSIQLSVDLGRVLAKLTETESDYDYDQPIYYSFGVMKDQATPIQIMRQNSDGWDGLLSESSGDGVKGSTATTTDGWCAEFALSWEQLYSDYSWKSYAEFGSFEVSAEEPLEIGCALYYLSHDIGISDDQIAWAAGTLKNWTYDGNPSLRWNCDDHGIKLYVPYSEDHIFNFDKNQAEPDIPDVPAEGSQGLKYRSNGDGTCAVVGIGTCDDVDLVIPEKSPAGDIVTSIGDQAFYNCSALVSVIIPDSVTSIGEETFSMCDRLTTVTLSNNLTATGYKSFASCNNLKTIFIPASLIDLGPASFVYCPSLESIQVDERNPVYHSSGNCLIQSSTQTLIVGCKNSEIPANGSVTCIEASAFDGCSFLTNITIPEGVVSIGHYAFAGCSMTNLILPESLQYLGIGVFSGCYDLISINIPHGITRLQSFLFEACYSLTNVTIPDSVLQIQNLAFSGCWNLVDVYYEGTASQWKAVSIGHSNGNLPDASIYFGKLDPNDPLYVSIPEQMYDFTQRPIQNSYWSDIAEADVVTEDGRTYIRLITDRDSIGDPYVAFTEYYQNLQISRYMAISYRTNGASNGQIHMGSSADHIWTGEGDFFDITWNGNGEWNLAIVDLDSVDLPALENYILNYGRIDFFGDAGAEGDYFDIEYIAFFNTVEAAEQYDYELHRVPMWDEYYGVVTHLSFDQLFRGVGMADVASSLNVFTPGQSETWNHVAEINNAQVNYLTYWGWVGIVGDVGSFGYQINNGTPIYNDAWTHETEDAVYNAAFGTGADTASRMKIGISLVDLPEGEYTIQILYRSPDGEAVCLTEFVLIIYKSAGEYDEFGNFWGDPSIFSVCADNIRFWVDETYMDGCTREGNRYLEGLERVVNVDGFSHISFRGWANPDGVEIASFGYQINGEAPVFDDSFVVYDPELNEVLGSDAVRRFENIMIPVADLAVGSYQITLLVKDTDGIIYSMNMGFGGDFTIEKTENAEEDSLLVSQSIITGIRGYGGPYSWADMSFGQRYDFGENVLESISIMDMATYEDGGVNTWVVKVWQWNGTYEDTVISTPLYVVYGEDHANNTTLTIKIPTELCITGDVYYEIEYLSGSKFFTGWDAAEWVSSGVQTYVSGVLTPGTYVSFFFVRVPFVPTEPEDPNEPELPDGPVLPDEPERPEPPAFGNYNIPMELWSVSGHKPGITSWTDPEHGSMVNAGYLDNGALLHQGSIGVGEIDLSKYSHVIVYCGCDNSFITQDHYDNSANNRIILSKADTHMTDSPAEEDIIAATTYTLHGWVPEAVVIDLTGIDYNGPVYITYDTLPGTFMLFSSIEFVAYGTDEEIDVDWTTYRGAGNYPTIDDEDWEEIVYPPESGYEYTADGFTVIQPDWTDIAPLVTVSTVDTVNLKDGLYLEFRVDDFSYGGDMSRDHWICLSLNTGKIEDGAAAGFEAGEISGKIQPGSTAYGGGWLTIFRSAVDGEITSLPHLTDPKTDEFDGSFLNVGVASANVTLDDEGREVYTLEVIWNGSEYIIMVNGVVQPGQAQTTALLEKLAPDGNLFVGITMMTQVKGGSASLTITKVGTSAFNAAKPVGTDSKQPEENLLVEVPVADPSTVEENMPAILWTPETYDLKEGNNCAFTAQEDNTWHCTASDQLMFFNLKAKRTWSYDAADFPVFGIMIKNPRIDIGTMWYAAGEISGAHNDYTVPFSIYDGEFFGEKEEYVFIPIDLSDLWEGRINSIRLDLCSYDGAVEFDLCFAGMFRSAEEAYEYANAWMEEIEP